MLSVLLVSMTLLLAGCARDVGVKELSEKWAPPPSTFIIVDGMDVHMRDEGPRDDPSPIVLLHGTSASLHTWQGWVDQIKGQRRVISLDLPGFGLTGPFPDDHYDIDHYVKFMNDFLTQLHVQHYDLVGNSFGGNLAWHIALAHPSQVGHLVLVDSAGYDYQPKSMPIGFRIAQIPILNKILEYTLPRGMVASSVRSVYADPSKVTPELVDRYYDLTLRKGNRHALVQRFKIAIGVDAYRIHLVSAPTLILWGAKDQLIPVEYGQKFNQDIKGSQLVVLDNLGHVPHEEDPIKSFAPVKTFLDIK
jgi:pimeloyl-ACP methyl ester carboxylesterase